MNKNRKKGVPLRAVLLYICLCTFVVIGVTFSKYIATSNGGDEARVVKFDDISITEEGDFVDSGEDKGKLIVAPGVDIVKKATLDFAGSETASYIFVEVTANGFEQSSAREFVSADGKISLAIDDSWNVLPISDNKYAYYIALEPNTPLNSYPIIKDGVVDVDWTLKNSELKKLGALSIAFKATAVQTDGRSAEATWALINGN